MTDEIEEKTTAINMLSAIIVNCGVAFAPYIEGTIQILMPMLMPLLLNKLQKKKMLKLLSLAQV